MKQILQSLKTGATEIADVPCPAVQRGQLLIRSTHTLVSAGTERMLVEFGKAGWIEKARQQPDKVRMVLEKIKTDGLLPTVETVFNKLDQPLPLGYCNIGVVLETGPGVTGFAPGDRVVSNGKHAEVVGVPVNLCARVPDAVPDEDAAFTVLGAIALQGIRLVGPTLGEAVVVTGLGLIGLMAVQLLRAQGCRVLGLDFDPAKLALARQFGAEVVDLVADPDPLAAAHAFSRGRGVDAVLITASTRSNEPVHQAARMCRQRGRIVLVGVTGLELSRADFYEKELTFQVSCSYGPGRYDPRYEEQGLDYPVGFVRWTEQRNFEAMLDLLAEGRLDVKPLISHRFAIAEAEQAYALVGGAGPSLGILLRYPTLAEQPEAILRRRTVRLKAQDQRLQVKEDGEERIGDRGPTPSLRDRVGPPAVSFIGAGNYATGVLIPAFKAAGARLRTVACNGGVSGLHAGRKFGFAATTTDPDAVFADPDVAAVVTTTRHDSHARYVLQALQAGKHVFVEKPLCLTLEELAEIAQEYGKVSPPTPNLPHQGGGSPLPPFRLSPFAFRL
ncbi:MAG: bi-domain-containing oxidoreductase, partial [Candidatus Competibacter sp.]|nr:bi-domain-containing oxidoreductase [Candidatus Competibacter sp.]